MGGHGVPGRSARRGEVTSTSDTARKREGREPSVEERVALLEEKEREREERTR